MSQHLDLGPGSIFSMSNTKNKEQRGHCFQSSRFQGRIPDFGKRGGGGGGGAPGNCCICLHACDIFPSL